MANELMTFNGLNGATGSYLLPEMSIRELSAVAQGQVFDKGHLNELKYRYETYGKRKRGVRDGVDPKIVSSAGWGVIFALADGKEAEQRKEALRPLLDSRQEQAGDYYKEYIGQAGYRLGETYSNFLVRNGYGPGQLADPSKVPYYLLIVAAPESVPYRFQYQLGVVYAVGRIHFSTLDEYARYAESVVSAESAKTKRSQSVAFFGPRNAADKATNRSAKELVAPLAKRIADSVESWHVSTHIKDNAYKRDLKDLLATPNGPALLFTASHGVGFPKSDHNQRQTRHQGALVCQDWPGPLQWIGRPIPPEHYFSIDDLDDCDVAGLIGFHFACYSAGTPLMNEFAHLPKEKYVEIADKAFVAGLPQEMLGHPKGGALAFIGHVERAWDYSFTWPGAGSQINVFEDTVKRLLAGHPVGSALECINSRYSELSTILNTELENAKFEGVPDDRELALLWTATNDARSYAIVGDPAVRLSMSTGDGHEVCRA